LARFFPN
jgi:solute carrier family 25 (adenine nucleotide translocator) protein 4/5/6/31